jgi:hypothetical protein
MMTIQTAPRFADPGRIVRFLSTPDATRSRSVPDDRRESHTAPLADLAG